MTGLTNDPTRDIYQQRLRENPCACPHCGSKDLLKVKPRQYAVFDDRRCQACGCQWTPAWPKTAAFGLLVVILGEIGGGLYLVWLFAMGKLPTWGHPIELTAGCAVLTLVVFYTLRRPLRFLLGVLGGRTGHPWVNSLEDQWLQTAGALAKTETPDATAGLSEPDAKSAKPIPPDENRDTP